MDSSARDNVENKSLRNSPAGGTRYVGVQHHYAHVLACMAENELEPPVLGVAWDGTGFGTDNTIWGGEFLCVTRSGFERVARLRPFPLPGGEAAVREPRRSALGLLFAEYGDRLFSSEADASESAGPHLRETASVVLNAFNQAELAALRSLLKRQVNCPRTSSIGRLFDAVAALLGLRMISRYEGQAAMELEFAATGVELIEPYPFSLRDANHDAVTVDWGPMLQVIFGDIRAAHTPGKIAARFHQTLAEIIVAVAQRIGERRLALTGGCFQNRPLLEQAVARLRDAGFAPFWHQRVPPNDGGIALGQAVAAMRRPA